MNKKHLVSWTLCLVLVLLQAAAVQAAPAASAGGGSLTYETAFAGSGNTLSSTEAQQQSFTVMDYWNVQAVTVELHFQLSQLTEEQRSSVTLSLNGSPFYSFRPSLKNNGEQTLRISAPVGFLRKGVNTLAIQGSLQTGTGEQGNTLSCNVDDAPDNWLHLFNTSNIAVKYTEKPITGGISDFYARFSGPDTVTRNQSLITVPENAAGSELEAAAYALSGMVKANALTDRTIPLLPYRSDTVADKQAVVLVALYDRLPAALKQKLDSGADPGTQALIQLVNRETAPVLVVTSKDESLLIKAGRLLANQELALQLGSELKIVDGSTRVEQSVSPVSRTFTFTETGDKLTGANHREQTYYVELPAGRSIADAGRISLDFRYAQNLDFEHSLVTVSINDTPIGSKKLQKELANGDTLNLPVPPNVNVSGNFSVKVAFDLAITGNGCSLNTEDMPWAYISRESAMQLNTKDRTELLFNNYPYPFLRDEIYNHVAVVLPQEMDDYAYRTLGGLFNLLGRYTGGNAGDVHFYTDDVAADNLKNNNVIAIGTFKNNKVIRDNNDKLYFQFSSDGSTLLSNEKMSIEEAYGSGIGTLQLVESPYARGMGFMAVTGVEMENVFRAAQLLSTESGKWKVFGDGVAADKDGNVGAYRFKTAAAADEESAVDRILDRPDVLGFVAAVVLAVAFVLVALILLLRKHLKKRGDKRET
ncbi:cellulose biosynthesis cyclic di-GMP-binding regulatory protein BcsB [Paenibacillus tengchongensis]|uniref:cellulose biosynthesis cyclic di-GMP-binding regulatory protein BcsB n=1 Tax=Paenibacillus tengchongensis TaxID=2608684 RepID=UPI00124D43C3|nr:cellulose biosynthesis cyclic di-GMP-binding regulatory protein BcsB [Paenibacillus tengchongensis]